MLVRREAINKTTPAYEAEPLRVKYKKGTRVVAKRPDDSFVTRTTAHFKKVLFGSNFYERKSGGRDLRNREPPMKRPHRTRENNIPCFNLGAKIMHALKTAYHAAAQPFHVVQVLFSLLASGGLLTGRS